MLPAPFCSAPTRWWWMRASGVLFCWELLLGMQSVGFIYFSSQLSCPPDPPVRGFPGILKLPLLRLPSQDGFPSLTLLSLFLSFILCPTSFRRQWAAFLGTWCPLLAIISCFVEFAQRSNDLWWICGGESSLPILFLHHLSSSSPIWLF